ncbi:hypothetical protein M1D46_00480 [Microbacterium sp. JZ70]
MNGIKRAPLYCIEATYKGETGYVTDFHGTLAGITPLPWNENIATYTDRATAETDAEYLRALQATAEPWDALTGINVIELKAGV